MFKIIGIDEKNYSEPLDHQRKIKIEILTQKWYDVTAIPDIIEKWQLCNIHLLCDSGYDFNDGWVTHACIHWHYSEVLFCCEKGGDFSKRPELPKEKEYNIDLSFLNKY